MTKRIPKTPETPGAYILYVLRHCSRRVKTYFFVALAGEAFATALDVMLAWVLGRIVGVIIEAGDTGDIWPPVIRELLLLAAIWTGRSIGYRIREYADRRYVPELMNVTRELLFNRLIQQSQSFLQSNFAGVLSNHVRRAGEVMNGLREKFVRNILPISVRFTTAGVLLWAITPKLTLFMFGFIVLAVTGAFLSAPKWTRLSTANASAYSRLSGYIIDSASNLSVVQQNTGWREEQHRFTSAQDDLTDAFVERMVFVSWFWGTFELVMTLFFCGFMVLVVQGWQTGDVSAGELAMAIALVTNIFGSLAHTLGLLSQKFDDIGILKDSLEKISSPLSIMDKENAAEIRVTEGVIEFRDVDFSYNEDGLLFENLSFTIPAGQKVGLVGISGAGKSTLCQLLLRGWDVTGGGIYIDGQNIAKFTQDSLRAAIAVIPQEPVLFHRSLADNIRYGRLGADDDDVVAAAKAAEAAAFIETLPQGYNTLVGERGVKLSGGQRQRIAIARAIVKDAPILILDEATSALDSETEKSIQSAMIKAMKGHTTLVIAHRLSTLIHMDRIIVMDAGRIVEDGSFHDLLEKEEGVFSRLWNMQAGGFLPEKLG